MSEGGMLCGHCGTEVKSGFTVCKGCGAHYRSSYVLAKVGAAIGVLGLFGMTANAAIGITMILIGIGVYFIPLPKRRYRQNV